jgi:hypothetical protein
MTTIVLSVGLVGAAMIAMAIGVILSDRVLQGSCGGSGDDCLCAIEKRRACSSFQRRQRELGADGGDLAVQTSAGQSGPSAEL